MPGCGWLIHRFGFEYRPLKDIWMFPKIGVPPNGWFTMENPIKIHDLGAPLFLETPIFQAFMTLWE